MSPAAAPVLIHRNHPDRALVEGLIRDVYAREYAAKVDSFADQADSQSTRRAFKVRIDLTEIDTERMRPGMSVKVEVVADNDSTETDRLLIPRAALLPTGSEISAVLKDGTLVAVELGPCNPDVCVLLNGPSEGTSLGSADSISNKSSDQEPA